MTRIVKDANKMKKMEAAAKKLNTTAEFLENKSKASNLLNLAGSINQQ